MTPAATRVRIEETRKSRIEQAWIGEMLTRAKRLPESPAAMMRGGSEVAEQSDNTIIAMAKMRAAAKAKAKG